MDILYRERAKEVYDEAIPSIAPPRRSELYEEAVQKGEDYRKHIIGQFGEEKRGGIYGDARERHKDEVARVVEERGQQGDTSPERQADGVTNECIIV